MSDKLKMDYINSLPQPLIAVQIGDGYQWPVLEIDVETGLMIIDIVGKLEPLHISEVREFIDADSGRHDPDTFYTDYEPIQEQGQWNSWRLVF
jgi:hypothetical protein